MTPPDRNRDAATPLRARLPIPLLTWLLLVLAAPEAVLAAGEVTEFRLGLAGGESPEAAIVANECYRAKLEEALGVPVRLVTSPTYDGVIDGFLEGAVDMAWLGASSFAKIHLSDPDAVDVTLTKQNKSGLTGYFSYAFTRKDSGIRSIEDARGRTFAFGEPDSTSGYLIPAAELSAEYGDLSRFFAATPFSGGHEKTIVGVVQGQYDAGVSAGDGVGSWDEGFSSGPLRKAVSAGLVRMSDLVMLWQSRMIPEGPLVIGRNVPQPVRDIVVPLTARLHETDAACARLVAGGEAKDFVPTTIRAYSGIIEARKLQEASP
ncbi:phosphate/phosphite/phosphonate ABC transporter substrate-binding protein [Cereibacter sphaeroides]|uniref:phosphate/phosphite/phosphonate ABC transporter substrate-binding protein n=1 Tax=Cereibacter sphaeroides TaxID=1063 RepID=UPI001F342914|nr:phosphate/phosphite/phosphonate ABC transporter substrate-binding protein [Cereibacter sphaeroides]MCE6949546.1 phosphate/phosphite/phosphonate ABC transporter substrate-binding protein [Cereibacter sphaeroides]